MPGWCRLTTVVRDTGEPAEERRQPRMRLVLAAVAALALLIGLIWVGVALGHRTTSPSAHASVKRSTSTRGTSPGASGTAAEPSNRPASHPTSQEVLNAAQVLRNSAAPAGFDHTPACPRIGDLTPGWSRNFACFRSTGLATSPNRTSFKKLVRQFGVALIGRSAFCGQAVHRYAHAKECDGSGADKNLALDMNVLYDQHGAWIKFEVLGSSASLCPLDSHYCSAGAS